MAAELDRVRTPQEVFEAKIGERLRADIGTMLPDDVLASLVTRAVDDIFFKPRKIERNYSTETVPPWFAVEVAKVAEPMMRDAVVKFLAERQDVIVKAMEQFLSDNQLAVLVSSNLSGQLSLLVSGFVEELRRHG